MSGDGKITGLLRPDQTDTAAVGDLVTGGDGRTYRVTGRDELGGTGRFIYTLEPVDDARTKPARNERNTGTEH